MSTEQIENELITTRFTLERESERGHFQELWQGVNLKRTTIVIFVNFFQQATGQAFASQYGTIFIKSLGTVNAFDMTLINGAVNAFAVFLSLISVDRIGRKSLLLAGAAIQLAALVAMGSVGTVHAPTRSEKTAIVALLSVFSFGFSIGWAPLTYVVTTELPALYLRDQSQRVASLVNVVTAYVFFVTTFPIHPLQENTHRCSDLWSASHFLISSTHHTRTWDPKLDSSTGLWLSVRWFSPSFSCPNVQGSRWKKSISCFMSVCR